MRQLSLVFADDRRMLGEVVTQDGAFASLTLSAAGEDMLGDHVRDWQVHGVPVLHDRVLPNQRAAYHLTDDRVMLRDAAFLAVLRMLLESRRMTLVTLSDDGVMAWEKMSGKKLSDAERFKKILAVA